MRNLPSGHDRETHELVLNPADSSRGHCRPRHRHVQDWRQRHTRSERNHPWRGWYNQALATWTLLRDWNTSNLATWFPANPGLYAVQVWVRTAGTLVTYEDWKNTEFFGITTSTGLTLTADRALGTLRHGELVRWTATVSGGTGPWEYAFFTFNGTSWTLQAPGYSAQNQFDWVVSAGTRAVQVWVRSAGSAAAWERWQGSGLFLVNP